MKNFIAMLLFLCFTGLVYADSTFVAKVHSGAIMGRPAKDTTMTTYIKGKKERMNLTDEGQWMMIDLDQNKMYMVDDTKKTAMVGSADQIKKMGSMIMGNQKLKATVQKTGKSESVAGVPCDEYSLTTTGEGFMKMNGTFCMADISSSEYEPFKEYGQDFMKWLGADELAKLKGVPVKSNTQMSMAGQNMESSYEVTSIKHDPVPDSKFAIPGDYKISEMPAMPQQPQHP